MFILSLLCLALKQSPSKKRSGVSAGQRQRSVTTSEADTRSTPHQTSLDFKARSRARSDDTELTHTHSGELSKSII